MRRLLPFVLLSALVAAPTAARAVTCAASVPLNTGYYAYNVPQHQGLPDGRWLVTTPGATGPVPAVSVYNAPGWFPPYWTSTWAASSGLTTGSSDGGAAIGTYTYQTTFTIPAGASYSSILVSYAIDNDVVWKVNGTVVATLDATGNDAAGWGTLHSFQIVNIAPLQVGVNLLTAEIVNREAWEGLYVIGGYYSCV